MRQVFPIFRLPLPIRALFLIFLLTPVLLLAGHGSSSQLDLLLRAAAYWGLPWILCGTLLYRPHWFLALYLVECVALTAETWAHLPWTWSQTLIRCLLIACNTYGGITFGNKRLFYPFLSRKHRFWRLHPRIEVRVPVYLNNLARTHEIAATMVDCSDGGMGLELPLKAIVGAAVYISTYTKVVVHLVWRGEDYLIPSEISWWRDAGEVRKFGVRALDPLRMQAFMKALTESFTEGVSRQPVPSRALRPGGISIASLLAWSLMLPLMLALPWLWPT